ncbi:hypothetical protein H8R18_08340 [Nanchangia anserum]|uniref:Uncharacterized protein n=1 Tax=Nanchangia anserum TaxID=2692125 RepID=A0A8I0KNQ3_9ACTO|nr:hypothetical protein [Nanchangia anserum]MBD3689526.1 hypothetical protein [Nanchangia anserum]QOX81716.1 hypothetical protein H8R18_08340 [Nanchangia anserum]
MIAAAGDLIPTTPFGAWVLWLGMVLVFGSAAVAGWMRIVMRIPPAPRQLLRQRSLHEISIEERRLLLSQVDEVRAEAVSGQQSLSQTHLSLAAILRALGTRATTQNLEVATLGEIRRALGDIWPDFCDTLARCQEPSFAALSRADLEENLTRVRTLIYNATQAADVPDAPRWRDRFGRAPQREAPHAQHPQERP